MDRALDYPVRVGLALLAPPAAFLLLVALKYGLSLGYPFDALDAAFLSSGPRMEVFNAVTPALFLGGPLLAIALNAAAMVRGSLSVGGGNVVGTFALRPRATNMLVIAASGAMLATFAGYALAENWQCWAGSATSC